MELFFQTAVIVRMKKKVLVKPVIKFLGIPLRSLNLQSSTEEGLKRKLYTMFHILHKIGTSVSSYAFFRRQQQKMYESLTFFFFSFSGHVR